MYVTTEDGLVELLEVQMSGKKRMMVKDFLNGSRGIEEGMFESAEAKRR